MLFYSDDPVVYLYTEPPGWRYLSCERTMSWVEVGCLGDYLVVGGRWLMVGKQVIVIQRC